MVLQINVFTTCTQSNPANTNLQYMHCLNVEFGIYDDLCLKKLMGMTLQLFQKTKSMIFLADCWVLNFFLCWLTFGTIPYIGPLLLVQKNKLRFYLLFIYCSRMCALHYYKSDISVSVSV
jgi:hypothetical protein